MAARVMEGRRVLLQVDSDGAMYIGSLLLMNGANCATQEVESSLGGSTHVPVAEVALTGFSAQLELRGHAAINRKTTSMQWPFT